MTDLGTSDWSLLTNHGHVLLCIAEQQDIRIREIAARAGITERATQRIIADLERNGFLTHERIGRRNRYSVDVAHRSGHPLERHLDVETLAPSSHRAERST